MATSFTRRGTSAALAGAAAVTLALAGCASTDDGDGDSGATSTSTDGGGAAAQEILLGTTDKITTIDPAGSYDNGSFAVMTQVYPVLLNTPSGSPDVEPDIAESAEFISPTDTRWSSRRASPSPTGTS